MVSYTLAGDKTVFSDNEYTILSEIDENRNITQRELSKALGVSVSTVNVLMNKMMREGLVKMTQVSQRQVLYMLTPTGMMEKAKKTVSYLKAHYRAIYETTERIKEILADLATKHDVIYVLTQDDEMGEIMKAAVRAYLDKHKSAQIQFARAIDGIDCTKDKAPVLVYMMLGEGLVSDLVMDDKMTVVDVMGLL